MTNAGELVVYPIPNTWGEFFRCSRRTAAHIDYTRQRLAKADPSARLSIIQGCYNTSVPASAGTHDYDCCLDIRIEGWTWPHAQRFVRAAGWGGWWRKATPGLWGDHIHMVSLGFESYPIRVGEFVPGQVVDYYNHATGLAGQHEPGSDRTWHPKNIDATIFNYEKWEQEQEENMGYRDWDQADKDALMSDISKVVASGVKDLPTKVWAFLVRKKSNTQNELTARAALRQAAEED